jgi:hypothetical protein
MSVTYTLSTSSYSLRLIKIAPIKENTAIVGDVFDGVFLYLSISTTALSMIQVVSLAYGSSPQGIIYVDDTRVIVTA